MELILTASCDKKVKEKEKDSLVVLKVTLMLFGAFSNIY